MAWLAILGRLILLVGCLADTRQQCADMDSQACEFMGASNPNLCSDATIAKTACPKFCNLCPIECYHCNTTLSDYHNCKTTKLCAQHEACMQKEVTSIVDGHHAYQLTCETKDRCDGSGLTLNFGKRGLEVRDVSITCCLKDRCNNPAKLIQGSKGCKKDVIVVVEYDDTQDDLEARDIEKFLLELASKLPIGQDGVLMSVAYVSGHFHALWKLDTHPDNASLASAIRTIPHTLSRIDRALGHRDELAILAQKIVPENRKDADDILIVMTDEQDGGLKADDLFHTFLGQFDKVLAIGVGASKGLAHWTSVSSATSTSGFSTAQGQEFLVPRGRQLNDIVPSVASLICPTSN